MRSLGVVMQLNEDLSDLVAEVLSNIPRLLALQDRDPDSPMRGCMHPAYWRDKSSDVADMRRQEAALTFAWVYKHPFPDNPYQGDKTILHAAIRAMGFWMRQQHRDGTFDEWYKNEHGYATTAFSSYAMSLALMALKDELPAPLRNAVISSLRRCGEWLSENDDWFKTNHQAVGVAALAAISRALDAPHFAQAAQRNCHLIFERMHEEGWSSEISGLDLGYTFLLAEYLAMYTVLTDDRSVLPGILRAFRFAASFLHPDLTTGAEYGICANPYFSRVAVAALHPHDAQARAMLRWMERPQEGARDTSATLKDDLRLARYAYQPLLASLLCSETIERRDSAALMEADAPLLFQETQKTSWYPEANLAAIARPAYAAWFSGAYGGFVRVAYRDDQNGFLTSVADRGYAIVRRKHTYRNARYRRETTSRRRTTDSYEVEVPLIKAGFVMPPYWARVGLRVTTSLPGGPKGSRWLIDQWRRRKGTALNQSAAGVAGGDSPYLLIRSVHFDADQIRITDRLTATEGELNPATTFAVFDGPVISETGASADADRRISMAILCPDLEPARTFRIHKTMSRSGNQVRVSVRCEAL